MTLSYQILESIRNTDRNYEFSYDELFTDKECPYDDDYEYNTLPITLEDRADCYIKDEEEIHFGELLECLFEFCIDQLVTHTLIKKEYSIQEVLNRFSDEWSFEIANNLRTYLLVKRITFIDDNGIKINNPQNCLFEFGRM